MKKCGMTYGGTWRAGGVNNQGICDEAWYSILREEYENRKCASGKDRELCLESSEKYKEGCLNRKMVCKTFEINELKQYKYVVVLSRYNGKILLSRHKERTTWETQGGHIEPGETPLEAAKRELYEESGALEYDIIPLCDYWAGAEDRSRGAGGMVFAAFIRKLGEFPESEMAEVQTFDALPENLTYPAITPVLFARAGW